MKAYISCPCSHSKKRLALLPTTQSIAEKNGWETFVFLIGGTPAEIFKRDYNQLKSSDIIITEVSERSHGIGAEIGISFCLGLKRILLIEKGENLTKFILGMPDTVIVEYENQKDLEKKLNEELVKIKK